MAITGRPPKFKKEFCKMLETHMAEGLSFKSFGAEIDVCEDTLHEWCKKFKSFSESKKRGREKQQSFYEKVGRKAMLGKIPGFNSTAFVWMTKNMIGWRDKQDIDVKGVSTPNLPQIILTLPDNGREAKPE